MNDEQRNALIAAIWAAMDATGGDESDVRDTVDQAVRTWEPSS